MIKSKSEAKRLATLSPLNMAQKYIALKGDYEVLKVKYEDLLKYCSKLGGDWHYCHKCQMARGAKLPKGGQGAITVTSGECGLCGKQATLVPNNDYDWPKKGRKAWFD